MEKLSLDHSRTLVALAGMSDSLASRRDFGRAQSVISQIVAKVEAELGVIMLDRSGRHPVLTERGMALLVEARAAVAKAGP